MSPLFRCVGAVLFVMTSLLPMASLATKYVGKVRIYVEKSAEDAWKKSTGNSDLSEFAYEMNSTFYEINEIYHTLNKYNVDIELQIADIIHIPDFLKLTNQKIIGSEALRQFEDVVGPGYADNKYDLAILYTGNNVVNSDGSDGTFGTSYPVSVCSIYALGIMELRGTFADVLATAHEIGHIFGAYHEGTEDSKDWDFYSGEIMNAATNLNSHKHFYFSSCSAAAMEKRIKNLDSDGDNCLTSWSASGTITGPRYATLLSTPEEICHRKFGPKSQIYKQAYSSYGHDVCVKIKCLLASGPTTISVGYELSPSGLNCGKNKQCIRGKCVETENGSDQVSDSCPFGDQVDIEGNHQYGCSKIVPRQCIYQGNACCQKCQDPGTADDVCKRLAGNDSSLARRYYEEGYGDLLCSRLACLTDTKGKTFSWEFFTAPDNMKCGEGKRCNGGKCVSDTMGDPWMSDTCPFGDQPWLGGDWQTTCAEHTAKYGCPSDNLKLACCGSCEDPGTADEICRKRDGGNATLARLSYSSYGDELCSSLICLVGVRDGVFGTSPGATPDGLKCGKNKRCRGGQCVDTVTGDPNMSDGCPWGDQPYIEGDPQGTCSQVIPKDPNGCEGTLLANMCCDSCNQK